MTTINTNPYLATTDESERPAINSIPYLVRLSGGAGVTSGYYYNEKFYKDAAHTQEITPKQYQLYLDITDGENKLYTYDGTEYVVVSGGGGAITITGHVNTVSDLPSVTEVEEGTAYAVGTTQPYDIYVVGYEHGSPLPSWINIGPIRGPKGDTGDDGATFTPSVSAAGVISWTNDGGKTNPDPVNIKGPQGNPGADGKIQDVQVNGSSKVTGTTANITTVQNLTSATSTEPLAANQGKILNDRINNLESLGKYLAVWNCATGLPATNPPEMPYTYKTGDYYRVGTISQSTNYKPNGSSYDGTASTTTESETITEGSVYYYDGQLWKLQTSGGQGTVMDVQVDGTSVISSGVANFESETLTFTLANGTTTTLKVLLGE